MMDKFELSDDDERIRAAIFPKMSPFEYAEMLKKKRENFAEKSDSEKARIIAVVDRMGESVRRNKEQLAENVTQHAIIKAKRSARRAPK